MCILSDAWTAAGPPMGPLALGSRDSDHPDLEDLGLDTDRPDTDRPDMDTEDSDRVSDTEA